MLSRVLNRGSEVSGYYDASKRTSDYWIDANALDPLFAGLGRQVQFSTCKEPDENSYYFDVAESGCSIRIGKDKDEVRVSATLRAWFKSEHSRGYCNVRLLIL